MFWEKTLMIIISLEKLFVFGCELDNNPNEKKLCNQVNNLVKKWSPLVYLAPGELFMPSSVDDFIENVYSADANGFHVTKGLYTQNLYLKTLQDVDDLRQNKNSFLYGNKNLNEVPSYAIVNFCQNSENSSHLTNRKLGWMTVSYWYFYPFNLGKEICFLGKVPTLSVFSQCFGNKVHMGNHVGDWEHVTISFKHFNYPDSIFVSSHEFGAYYRYNPYLRTFIYESQSSNRKILSNIKFPKFLLTKDDHPVLFSAWGSHGFWAEPGNHTYFFVPKLQDTAGFGELWQTWKNIKIYQLGVQRLPKWVTFKGRWGNPRSNCILFRNLGLCKQADGPLGPRGNDYVC